MKIFRNKENDKSFILRNIPMLSELNKFEMKKIESIMHERTYEENEIIFYEGEPGVGMFIVKEGEILLFREKSEKEEVIDVIKVGEFFGELALLIEKKRLTSARAVKKTVLLGLFRPDLLELINLEPRLGVKLFLKVSEVLSERLYSLSKK